MLSYVFLVWQTIFTFSHLYQCPLKLYRQVASIHNGNAYEVLSDTHKYLTFGTCLFCFFFSFTQITFDTVHLCVSIHNTNTYDISSDSHKYPIFGSYI